MQSKAAVFGRLTKVLFLIYFFSFAQHGSVHTAEQRRPNIVLLLADDLGYGDLGCYGNDRVATPNIDGLARDGLRFTRMYTESSCTAARAALLTGVYPIRLGLVRDSKSLPMLRNPDFHSHAQAGGLNTNLTKAMLSTFLKAEGYATALIGKWGLGFGDNGKHLPINLGFDVFYGTPGSHSAACSDDITYSFTDIDITLSFGRKLLPLLITLLVCGRFGVIRKSTMKVLVVINFFAILIYGSYLSFTIYNSKSCVLMDGDTIIEQPYNDQKMTLRTTKKALDFIATSAAGSQPFFLFMSYLQTHLPPIVSPSFKNSSGSGSYDDALIELDWSVGKITKRLQSLGIYDETLIIFTSDNGPVLTDIMAKSPLPDGNKGSTVLKRNNERIRLKGEQSSVWEGGIRVPAIFTWKPLIDKNTASHGVASLRDILPTIQGIINPESGCTDVDGKSLLKVLQKSYAASPNQYLMHYCDNSGVAAVTTKKYKIHFKDCNGLTFEPPLFFDIEDDPSESISLGPSGHGKIILDTKEAISRHEASVEPVPSQFAELLRPWLYPCSNFPICKQVYATPDDFDDLLDITL